MMFPSLPPAPSFALFRPRQNPAGGQAGFVSMARVAAVTTSEAADDPSLASLPSLLRTHVHVVFGLSKDFCASGLRVGCLHSRNPAVNSSLENLSYFSAPSGALQAALAEALSDRSWLDAFFLENETRLLRSYSVLAEALSAAGIPYVPAVAAMFVWADLRELLWALGSDGHGAGAGAGGAGGAGGGALTWEMEKVRAACLLARY